MPRKRPPEARRRNPVRLQKPREAINDVLGWMEDDSVPVIPPDVELDEAIEQDVAEFDRPGSTSRPRAETDLRKP